MSPAPPASRPYGPGEGLRVSLELTDVCNFRCPFCPQALRGPRTHAGAARRAGSTPFDRARGYMSPAVFERAVAECQRAAETVELGFFGEQTLHPRYLEYLQHLRERRFGLELNTNVSLVTREAMQVWIDVAVDQVRLSLDAVTPEVFNRARPGAVRDLAGRAVSEAERMKAVNDKVHWWLATPEHRPTRLVFVKSSYNEGERERFAEYWTRHLGPQDTILMKQVLTYGGKVDDPLVEPHRCNVWDMRYLMIDWRGVVSPCNLDTNMDLALGNVMHDSLDALYHGPQARRLRGATGCGRDLAPCRTCVDGNNWSRNEVLRNPLHESAPGAPAGAREATARRAPVVAR